MFQLEMSLLSVKMEDYSSDPTHTHDQNKLEKRDGIYPFCLVDFSLVFFREKKKKKRKKEVDSKRIFTWAILFSRNKSRIQKKRRGGWSCCYFHFEKKRYITFLDFERTVEAKRGPREENDFCNLLYIIPLLENIFFEDKV